MYPHQMHNNVFLSLQQQQFTGTFLTYNSNVGKRQQYIRTFFPYNCNVNSNTNAQERFYLQQQCRLQQQCTRMFLPYNTIVGE